MSPITASAFLLLGLALLGIDWRTQRGRWPAQFFSLAAGSAATFGILSFAFDPGIYAAHLSLALPTAVNLAVFSLGLVCARTEWGLGALLCSQSLGGSLARRLLPAAFVPVVVGWIRWQITATGHYSEWSIVALAALITISLLAGLIAWASSGRRSQRCRAKKVEAALHVTEEQLNRLLDRFDEPLGEALLPRKVVGGFVAAVLLMTLTGFCSWHSAQRAEKDSDWVTHTHAVLMNLEAAMRHLVNVETGGRGFALSGHEPFLEPYETGRRALAQDLDELRHLTADNPHQQRRLEVLGPQVNARIDASAELVAARRQTGPLPTLAQLEHGKQLMDAARATLLQLEAEENRLLDERAQKTRTARGLTMSVIILGSLMGTGFLVIAGFAISQQIGANARARAQVNALNAELEQRVEQRTAALGESEDRLAGVIRSAMDSIITVDEQQHILLFNSAAERLFRCPAAEALGQPLDRFIPQRFRSAHSAHIRKFGETGTTNRAMGALNPLWAVRADGQEFQIEASISQIEAAGKKLFTVILRDITERVQADEARDRLVAVVESSEDAIVAKTLEGTITAWNPGAEKLFGYLSSEALGKSMLMLLPPERAHEESDILARIRRGESVDHFETVRVRKDGRRIDVSATISPIKDSSGAIVGASNIARDTTERKRAETALAAQAEELSRRAEELAGSRQALQIQTTLLQSVLDNIGEGLVAADEHGRFVLWNPAAEKIVGLGAANVPSEEWTEHYGLYLPDTVTPFPVDQNPLARAIRGEATTAEMFVRNPKLPEGTWIEANAHPLRDADGKPRGGVVAFRDVTQRKRAEQEIHKLNDELEHRVAERTAQLEEANKELESFTYSVAHDLRAPLRHIAGFSGILVEEFGPSLNPQAQSYLQRIQDGAHKMGRLVDELLTLARVGRQALNLQVSGLSSIVKEVIGILQPEMEGRQVEWKIAELPFVEGDPTLLKLVFQNLISNSLKYSRPRPLAVIEIGQIQVNGDAIIFVRDNGVGFSMKYADKLFGVFQRLHRSEDFEGTGVGLATVQRIVKKHQGRIWAEAELDKGATFYFTLGGRQPGAAQTEAKKETMTVGA